MFKPLLGMVLVLAFVFAAGEPLWGQPSPWYEGTVVSAAGNRLVLTDNRGFRRVDRTDAFTLVTINGRPARLASLRPGIRVKVFLDDLGNVDLVETINTSP